MTKTLMRLFLCSTLSVVAACGGDEGVALSVNVVTSIVPQAEFSYVQIQDLAPTPLYSPSDVLDTIRKDAFFGQDYVHGVRVAAFDNITPGEHLISVSLLRADTTILISRRVRVTFDRDFVLNVHLTPDCVGVVCPSPAGSPALSECLGGQCVDERCIPPDGEFCPEVSFCNSEEDCPMPVVDCASRTCVDGVCGIATAGTCDAGEYCDPARGCVSLVVPDAGMPDDSGLDAGIPDADVADGGTMPDGAVCGSVCVLPDEPCRGGVISCAGGTATCVPYIVQPVGSSCGENKVCDIHGACSDCTAGATCSVGCVQGNVTCGAGYAQCDVSHGTTPLGLGAACSPTGACVEGMPCGDGETCDGSGTCRGCVNAEPCQVGCETGRVSCADDGVCVLDTILPPGSGCGDAVLVDHTLEYTGYCDLASTCQDCVRGAACLTVDGCADGGRRCDNEGLPEYGMCVAIAPHAAGTECASGAGDAGDLCNGASACVTPFRAASLGASAFSYGGTMGACAIDADHKVTCFGMEGTYRKDGVPDAFAVDASLQSGCLLSTDDEVWCWDGTHAPMRMPIVGRPVAVRTVQSGGSVSGIAAILDTGELVYTDPNTFGLDGTLLTYGGASNFVEISSRTSRGNYLALRASGEVLSLSYLGPVYVDGVDDATSLIDNSSCMMRGTTLSCLDTVIGAGVYPYGVPYHVELQNITLPYSDVVDAAIVEDSGALCMLRASGRVSCFGNARASGRGPSGDFTTATEIPIDNIVELGSGCMRDDDDRVFCWADLIGVGSAPSLLFARPTLVAMPEACELDAPCPDGVVLPQCFVREISQCEGGLQCENRQAQIGTACDLGACNGRGSCYTPFVARGTDNDGSVVCAIKPDGVAVCWGYNVEGVLGDPAAPLDAYRGVGDVVGVTDVVELAVSYRYACALSSDGTVRCWGAGSAMPAPITLSAAATHIAAYRPLGETEVCAVLSTHAVECWTPSSGVTTLAAISDADDVQSSPVHMCFLRTTGGVSCMGQNSGGTFGDGTMASSYGTLVDMLTVNDASALFVSSQATCVRRSDGGVWCTGNTSYDPLLGPQYDYSPVDMHLPMTDAVSVVLSDQYGFVLRPDGTIWSWYQDPATITRDNAFPPVSDDLTPDLCISVGPHGLYCGYPWALQPVTLP